MTEPYAVIGHPRDDLGVLVEQAAAPIFLWRGVRPQTAVVLERLRGLV